MRLADFLTEGVNLKGNEELAAYMLTVAEAYAEAPVHEPSADKFWQALNQSTMKTLFRQLKNAKLEVNFTETDPYARFTSDTAMMLKYMLYDMVVFRRLDIYSGDSAHPFFTEEENVAFRAVHDFFAHGKIRSAFFEQLKITAREMKISKLPPMEQAGPLLQNIDMSKFGNRGSLFSGRGELNAAASHIRIAPRDAAPALFTEVVGQVSYQIITGKFGTQKVVVLPGFDYNRLGVCLPNSKPAARMNQILSQIKNGAEEIQSPLGRINTQKLIQDARHGV